MTDFLYIYIGGNNMYLIFNKCNNSIIKISYATRFEIAKQQHIDILDYYKTEEHIILLFNN